jgi:hypothetical protein
VSFLIKCLNINILQIIYDDDDDSKGTGKSLHLTCWHKYFSLVNLSDYVEAIRQENWTKVCRNVWKLATENCREWIWLTSVTTLSAGVCPMSSGTKQSGTRQHRTSMHSVTLTTCFVQQWCTADPGGLSAQGTHPVQLGARQIGRFSSYNLAVDRIQF